MCPPHKLNESRDDTGTASNVVKVALTLATQWRDPRDPLLTQGSAASGQRGDTFTPILDQNTRDQRRCLSQRVVASAPERDEDRMIGVVQAVTSLLATLITAMSIYYRVCSVSYRIPMRSDQLVDFKTQPLHKYKYPHIGYRPDLAPPHNLKGWYGRAPFIATNGRTVLQEYISLPPSLGEASSKVPAALCNLPAESSSPPWPPSCQAQQLIRFVAATDTRQCHSPMPCASFSLG